MTEPYVRATRYIVNLIPESIGVYAQLFEITVERRGLTHRWAVVRHDQYLSSSGVWDDAPRASERDDGWLDEHRFGLDTALRLANEAAPHVTVKGRTAAEALARLIATGRIAPSTLRRMADEAQQQPDAALAAEAARDLAILARVRRLYESGPLGTCCRHLVGAALSGPGRVADEGRPAPLTPCTCRQAVHAGEHHTPVDGCPWCASAGPSGPGRRREAR